LKAAEASLLPANPQILAIQMAELLTYARAFGVPAQDIENASRFYQEALAHLPSDLLVLAMRRVRATHRYGMRLPLPSEITGTVSAEMAQRHMLVRKLAAARLAPIEQEYEPRASQAERDRVSELMAKFRTERSLAEAAAPREVRPAARTVHLPNPLLDAYVAKAREEGIG
jgi:hypothetical protein